MNGSKIFAVRLALFATLVWIGSACSGDQSVGAPLLTEGFISTFPGTNWTVPTTTGSGTSTAIVNTGDPKLTFSTANPVSSSSTTTTASFNNPKLTIVVQEAVTTATAGLLGSSMISIVDGANAVQATATWDNAAGTVSFTIAGLAGPSTATLPSDGSFHTFKFSVDAGGTATWVLDGATKQTTAPFPAGMLKLRLQAAFGTGSAWPVFSFDNISVTSP